MSWNKGEWTRGGGCTRSCSQVTACGQISLISFRYSHRHLLCAWPVVCRPREWYSCPPHSWPTDCPPEKPTRTPKPPSSRAVTINTNVIPMNTWGFVRVKVDRCRITAITQYTNARKLDSKSLTCVFPDMMCWSAHCTWMWPGRKAESI